MSDTSTSPTAAPRETAWLWWLCVVVIAAVFAAWSATRWKPVGWFPAIYGSLLGVVASLLANWIPLSLPPRRRLPLAFLSMVSASASFLLAAQVHMRREALPISGIAARMLEEHRRLAFDDEPKPGFSESRASESVKVWFAGLRDYLKTRYGNRPDSLLVAGLLLEATVAGGACWAAMRLMPHPEETAP